MKRNMLIAIIAAAILVPATVYAASPLFVSTTINEPLPGTADKAADAPAAGAGQVADDTAGRQFTGTFAGAGDGIHNAQGTANILHLDRSAVLRLEDFKVTNGPDLHVYLTTDKSASDYVDLGTLKASSGSQNYDLPSGTDLSRYDNVVIWCKSFSVYFGGAKLAAA